MAIEIKENSSKGKMLYSKINAYNIHYIKGPAYQRDYSCIILNDNL